jgi:hypothetical protein
MSDLISIQIPALVLYYYEGVTLPNDEGDVSKKVRVFGLKKLFLRRFTVRSTTRTLITDKNDHSAFTAIFLNRIPVLRYRVCRYSGAFFFYTVRVSTCAVVTFPCELCRKNAAHPHEIITY